MASSSIRETKGLEIQTSAIHSPPKKASLDVSGVISDDVYLTHLTVRIYPERPSGIPHPAQALLTQLRISRYYRACLLYSYTSTKLCTSILIQ